MRLAVLLLACVAAAPAATWRYWVEPCTGGASGCRAGDPELAEWALAAWQEASAGGLTLEKTAGREKARIRIYWAGTREGLYGEARPVEVEGAVGAEVYVRPTVLPPDVRDPLLRDAIVYLTCLHETGHALGLAHTAAFADIMYSFQFGGDIPEYFGRYRRRLRARTDMRRHAGMSDQDRARLRRLFPAPSGAQ
jgi:hypothetical protein